MGSLGFGEILVIVFVALIVFGPQRLPEITKKAGQMVAKAREMSRSFTESLDGELGELAAPIKDLKGEYDATIGDMKGIASSVTGMSAEMPDVSLNATSDRKSESGDAGVASDASDAKSESGDAQSSQDRAAATPDDEAS
jgi:sec-independent protein translocase protein TatB